MNAENPSGKSLFRLGFQKCHWGCYVEGGLFGEVRGTGGGEPPGSHSNSLKERRECLDQGNSSGDGENEQIQKIFRAEMQ